MCPRNTCLSFPNCAFFKKKKVEERDLGLLWVPLFNAVRFLLSIAAKDRITQINLHSLSGSPVYLRADLWSQVAPLDLKRNKIRSVPQVQTGKTTGKGEFANKLKYMELLVATLK